ncbi:MAG: peptidoglycan-binding protein [Rhizobiaceae bacterium]|nr:peptidoglycan-binding protein [Rhizobiaceae bacterium]
MTHRPYSPEALNAGRTRRSLPDQAQAARPEAGMVNELTRELDAIAEEIKRIKAARAAQDRAVYSPAMPERQPSRAHAPVLAAQAPDVSHAAYERMAGLVDGLKADVRNQLRDDLDSQYHRLRDELDMLAKAVQGSPMQGEFRGEIAELMRGLDTLSAGHRSIQRSQDDLSGFLKREMSALQSALDGVARTDGLDSLGRRWDALEDQWTRLEERVTGLPRALSPELQKIHDRLASLNQAASDNGLKALEERLLLLARSVDALAQQGVGAPGALTQIESRFDELSRAIAALPNAIPVSNASQQLADENALRQVEQALTRMAGKIEALSVQSQASPAIAAIEARVGALADGMARMHESFDPAPVMERLDRLTDRVASFRMPDISAASLDALTAQMNRLADEVRRPNPAHDETLEAMGRIDTRLGAIETRLGRLADQPLPPAPQSAGVDPDALLDMLERRFADLSGQLAGQHAALASPDIDTLERRLIDISNRITVGAQHAPAEDALARLENQLADLSHFIAARAGAADQGAAGFDPALMLEDQERIAIEAARRAADEIAARMRIAESNAGAADDVSALARELGELEQLTRVSTERNQRSFEAIHDTLVKLVDRISTLETPRAPVGAPMPVTMPAAAQSNVADAGMAEPVAPSIDTYDDALALDGFSVEPAAVSGKLPRTPQEMAQAAAAAAVGRGQPQATQPGAPDAAFDEPLAPGGAVPDLNAILKRVRDQKKAAQAEISQSANKKDFFSSVKRAAQAAAAEVESVDPKAGAKGKFGAVGDLYAKFRRPILMVAAAAIVAIGGLQLSSAFLGGDQPVAELPLATPDNAPASATASDEAAPLSAPQPIVDGTSVNLPGGVDLLGPETPAQDGPRVVGVEPQSAPADTAAPAITAQPPVDAVNAPSVAVPAPDAAAQAIAGSAALVASLPQGFGPQPLVTAATTGDAKAMFEIGRRFAENGADPEGLKTAVQWFDAAAQTGFAPAQYRLGNMHEKGLGTPLDAAKAKLWYQMAAEQGNASAMHNLAVLFANGAEGAPDAESAARWFVQAAELGVADSQYNLGILAAKGQGVAQDLEESYKWFAIVAKAGDKDAASKRDEIAKALRPEQLESARAKAELWKPKELVATANDISVPDEWRIAQATTASVDVKKAITNVQLILTKLGYDPGPADGVMGGKTRNAIRAFQKSENLPETGEIDAALVKALLAKNG